LETVDDEKRLEVRRIHEASAVALAYSNATARTFRCTACTSWSPEAKKAGRALLAPLSSASRVLSSSKKHPDRTQRSLVIG
jgi:hypothetical protein